MQKDRVFVIFKERRFVGIFQHYLNQRHDVMVYDGHEFINIDSRQNP
jgi:hypothetical protein